MSSGGWWRSELALWGCALALNATPSPADAQTPQSRSSSGIYSCVTADGRRLTSDRPIPECLSRGQDLLNPDGSVKGKVPASLTAEERAAKEADEARSAVERAWRQDAVRRDRNLKQRFPNETAHRRMREAALGDLRTAMKNSEKRLLDLAAERKPMLDELEFYVGRPVPPLLRQQIDANDAAAEAQRSAMQTQQAELERVTRLYDLELAHLRKLWAGAEPGSELLSVPTPSTVVVPPPKPRP